MIKNFEELCVEVAELKEYVDQLEMRYEEALSLFTKKDNIPFFDNIEMFLEKNLIIVGKNEKEILRFMKILEKSTDKNINFFSVNADSSESINSGNLFADIISLKEGEYFVFHSDLFLYGDTEIENNITEAIENNVLTTTIGQGENKKQLSLSIEKINYIMFTDNLKLVPDKLLELMEVV